jgi:hypothetical protein
VETGRLQRVNIVKPEAEANGRRQNPDRRCDFDIIAMKRDSAQLEKRIVDMIGFRLDDFIIAIFLDGISVRVQVQNMKIPG